MRLAEMTNAGSPWRMPRSAWKAVLGRTIREASADNVGLIAAGVSFYAFLALIPLLGAVVLIYGLIADARTVSDNMATMMKVLPPEVARLVGDQLMTVIQTSSGKKGIGLVFALAVALFGARNAAAAIITALNIAYEEEEKRGFVKCNLLALEITAAGVLLAVVGALVAAGLAYVTKSTATPSSVMVICTKILSYAALAFVAATSAALLYRFGPSHDHGRWKWLTPGSLLFAAAAIALMLGFDEYVDRLGNYNATYGSLAAVVIFLTWSYLSSYALVFGAELNSELERQIAPDTTAGAAQA